MSIEVSFIGKLGKKPELKGNEGNEYCVVGIAVTKFVGAGKGDAGRDGQPGAYKTVWIDTVFFKGKAKWLCERASQGDTVFVRGELDKKTYQKKDRNENVIDENAVSVKVLANFVDGPFRLATANNGNGREESAEAPAPATAPTRTNGQAQARPAQASRPAPAPARPAQAPRPAAPRPAAQSAPADLDDIPF